MVVEGPVVVGGVLVVVAASAVVEVRRSTAVVAGTAGLVVSPPGEKREATPAVGDNVLSDPVAETSPCAIQR